MLLTMGIDKIDQLTNNETSYEIKPSENLRSRL